MGRVCEIKGFGELGRIFVHGVEGFQVHDPALVCFGDGREKVALRIVGVHFKDQANLFVLGLDYFLIVILAECNVGGVSE